MIFQQSTSWVAALAWASIIAPNPTFAAGKNIQGTIVTLRFTAQVQPDEEALIAGFAAEQCSLEAGCLEAALLRDASGRYCSTKGRITVCDYLLYERWTAIAQSEQFQESAAIGLLHDTLLGAKASASMKIFATRGPPTTLKRSALAGIKEGPVVVSTVFEVIDVNRFQAAAAPLVNSVRDGCYEQGCIRHRYYQTVGEHVFAHRGPGVDTAPLFMFFEEWTRRDRLWNYRKGLEFRQLRQIWSEVVNGPETRARVWNTRVISTY